MPGTAPDQLVDGLIRHVRVRRLAGLAAAAVLTGSAPLHAQGSTYCLTTSPPPRFYTEAFRADAMSFEVRTVGGRRILVAAGGIQPDTSQKIAAALATAGPVEEVWLASPGGTLREGMAMGRMIKQAGLATRVPNGAACMSACTFAFLGGALRYVDPDSWYGIHSFSVFFEEKNVATYLSVVSGFLKNNDVRGLREFLMSMERSNAQLAADCARFLVEMSASLEFLTGTFGQKQLGMCFLSRAGLERYNVANAD